MLKSHVDSLQKYTVPSLYSSDRATLANITAEHIAVRIKTVFHTADIPQPFFFFSSLKWLHSIYLPAFIHYFVCFVFTALIMLVWHQFILLQETFVSTPPCLLSAPLWTCWSYSPNLLSLMMKLLLFTLHETGHTAMHVMTHCTHQRARMESEVKGRVGKIEMWLRPWVCNLLTSLIDIPRVTMFQGERKLIFQALKVWLNVLADDIRTWLDMFLFAIT